MEPPYLQRAKSFKSELFDSAGVEEKLLQKENEFMDLKKNMKLKVWQHRDDFFYSLFTPFPTEISSTSFPQHKKCEKRVKNAYYLAEEADKSFDVVLSVSIEGVTCI